MGKLVCGESELKADAIKYKQETSYMKTCSFCDRSALENVEHMIMICPYNQAFRNEMLGEFSKYPLWASIQHCDTLIGQ